MDGNAWAVVIVGVLSLAGTIVGTYGGIRVSAKLTAYRIEQLEKKVDKHNCLVERMYKVEERCSVSENDIKVVNHRITDLEEKE
jgi:hypothetical protein